MVDSYTLPIVWTHKLSWLPALLLPDLLLMSLRSKKFYWNTDLTFASKDICSGWDFSDNGNDIISYFNSLNSALEVRRSAIKGRESTAELSH